MRPAAYASPRTVPCGLICGNHQKGPVPVITGRENWTFPSRAGAARSCRGGVGARPGSGVVSPRDVRGAAAVDSDRLEVAQRPVLADVVADRARVVDAADVHRPVAQLHEHEPWMRGERITADRDHLLPPRRRV